LGHLLFVQDTRSLYKHYDALWLFIVVHTNKCNILNTYLKEWWQPPCETSHRVAIKLWCRILFHCGLR